MPEPALRLSGVAKKYGRRAVLRDVALEVVAGEAVAILGANGSGKSTLLRVAATLARPDAGHVEVCGVDARAAPEKARAGLSILTQDAPCYAELTPHEHLAWWARVQGRTLTPQAVELLTLEAGLEAAAHKPAGTLSRGMRQRLGLAMALLPERPLLLLDEPFSALDSAGRRWLEERLAARRGPTSTVLVLHDEADAARLADRTMRLVGGRLA